LIGSYAVALGVGLFAWGTPIGLAILAFAYGTHVVSAADAVRQGAFPGFGRWVPMISATGGLGMGIYLPAVALATLFAWPEPGIGPSRDGYLVNCRAYWKAPPRGDEWVWLRSSPWGERRLGRVVAGPGQEVAWSGDRLTVDDRPSTSVLISPLRPRRPPVDLRFTVPSGHALVVSPSESRPDPHPAEPEFVPQEQILGRVWAQAYPIRDRHLLP